MMLDGRTALIYGAGAIGGAMAAAFALEGAAVFIGGRTRGRAERLAEEIRANGGTAQPVLVDALDEASVRACVESVVESTGRLDISANVIGVSDVQKPLLEITVDEFVQPIAITARSHFLTTRAAAPQMISQGGGVILAFGGSGPQTQPGLGGLKVALDAQEGIRRQWAIELGPHNIRVVTLRTGGIVETLDEDMPDRDEIIDSIARLTMLRRTATLADVGRVAAFLASDHAASITSTEINISCGGIPD